MSKPLRIRVTGDIGKANDIQVQDADTGEQYTNVLEVTVDLSRAAGNVIRLTVYGGEVDLTGTVQPVVKDGELVTTEYESEYP
jgi:hypothetical protein